MKQYKIWVLFGVALIIAACVDFRSSVLQARSDAVRNQASTLGDGQWKVWSLVVRADGSARVIVTRQGGSFELVKFSVENSQSDGWAGVTPGKVVAFQQRKGTACTQPFVSCFIEPSVIGIY